MPTLSPRFALIAAALLLGGCTGTANIPGGVTFPFFDAGSHPVDAGHDAGSFHDAGPTEQDAGPMDAGEDDAGEPDSGPEDAGHPFDAGRPVDAGHPLDAGPVDAGMQEDAGGTDGGECGSDFEFCEANEMVCGSVTALDSCNNPRTVQCGVCATTLDTGNFTLLGATADNNLIYVDNKSQAYKAISTGGGSTPVSIFPAGSSIPKGSTQLLISNTEVFIWSTGTSPAAVGTLYIWDGTNGLSMPVSGSLVGFGASSADQTQLVYSTGAVVGTTTTANIVGAAPGFWGNSPPTPPVTLVLGATWTTSGGTACYSNGALGGLSFGGGFTAFAHCAAASATGTVSTWDPNWTKTDVGTAENAQVVIDPQGLNVIYTSGDLTQTLNEVPLDGSIPTMLVDDIAVGVPFIVGSDSSVYYVDTNTRLRQASPGGASQTTLVASGVASVLSVSPSATFVSYATVVNGPLSDVWFVPTSGGNLFQVAMGATAYVNALSAFTEDESYLLYLSGAMSGIGTFEAFPTGGGNVSKIDVPGSTAISPTQTNTIVVYADNVIPSGSSAPATVNLLSANVATTSHQSNVELQVDDSFVLTEDGSLVYTVSATTSGRTASQQMTQDGLFLIPQPQ